MLVSLPLGHVTSPANKPYQVLIKYHFYYKPRTAEKNTFTIYTNILRFFFGSLIVLGLLLYNLTTYWNSLKKIWQPVLDIATEIHS